VNELHSAIDKVNPLRDTEPMRERGRAVRAHGVHERWPTGRATRHDPKRLAGVKLTPADLSGMWRGAPKCKK